MRYVFYRIGPYEQVVREVLDTYFTESGIYRECSAVCKKDDILNEIGHECAIFYLPDSVEQQNGLHEFIKKHDLKAKMIALCRDYDQGMQALEKGDDYALQIPLNKEKVMRCCRYLDYSLQQEGGF